MSKNLINLTKKNSVINICGLKTVTEQCWINKGECSVLKLFHSMAERVPAYKEIIRKNHIHPETVRSIKNFKKLPIIDKDNYLRAYPIKNLCWGGQFDTKQWTICTTSGSTGEPFYFPHSIEQDLQYAIMAELYLLTNFHIDKKTTLYINGFPMGAWIGGVFTYKAVSMIAEKGLYSLSIINPGINKNGIISAIKNLGHKFDQVIIGSYAPFLKDTLDDGVRAGVKWSDYNLGFIFSAEGFSENFRDYVLKTAGAKNDYTTTLNHYGTVDLGTMSYETPLSVLIRRIAVKNPKVYKSLFGDSIKLPTLTQYFPELFYFEEIDKTLVCSAFSGMPLVRYNLRDSGGVYSFKQMVEKFAENKIDLLKEAEKAGIANTIWKLPFVYVYERNDFSISFYAFQIYPATIRRALEIKNLAKKITGKFCMETKFDRGQNQYIEIQVELGGGVKPSQTLKKAVTKSVTSQLLKESSEYRETYKEKTSKVIPRIIFWPYEHELFFKPGIKQKWVLKTQSGCASYGK